MLQKGRDNVSRGTTLIPGFQTKYTDSIRFPFIRRFPGSHLRVTCASRRKLTGLKNPSAPRLRWEFRYLQEPGKAFSQRPSLSDGKQIPTYIFIAFSNLKHIVYGFLRNVKRFADMQNYKRTYTSFLYSSITLSRLPSPYKK